MVKAACLLLVAVATLGVLESSANACWWKRHCSCNGASSGASNVAGVAAVPGVANFSGVQTYQAVQTVATVPMMVASPMVFQGYSGVQMVPASADPNAAASSEVAELKSGVASMNQEVQTLRSELMGTLIKDLFIPLFQDVVRSRLGVPADPGAEKPGDAAPGEKPCGCGSSGSSSGGITGKPVPSGPFGGASVQSADSDQMTTLLAKLEELITVLKDQNGNAAAKCEKCAACKECQKPAGDVPLPPPPPAAEADKPAAETEAVPQDKVSGWRAVSGRFASHRTPQPSTAASAESLDTQLRTIESKNRELRQRLDSLLAK